MPFRRLCLSALAAELLSAGLAWGPDGHTIVAHIADDFLSPEIKAALNAISGNVSLNNQSDWCDAFDHTPEGKWSTDLHFIDLPGSACSFDWARDCASDQCNVGTIVNYSGQIFDSSLSIDKRFVALKFVVHMVGDVHQPLHVAKSINHGGNDIHLPGQHFSTATANWSSKRTNLHLVWDDDLVTQAIYDAQRDSLQHGSGIRLGFVPTYHKFEVLVKRLENLMIDEWSGKKSAWLATTAGSWDEATFRNGLANVANETAQRGCEYGYDYQNGSAVKNGTVLGHDYYARVRPILEEQLAKAGVRLGQLLEEQYRLSSSTGVIVV